MPSEEYQEKQRADLHEFAMALWSPEHAHKRKQRLGRKITDNDILNIKIDSECAKDVNEFIEKM